MLKDKWFAANVALMGLLISLDAVLTVGGIKLGYKEGNPFMMFLFNNVGMYITIVIFTLIALFCVYILLLIREWVYEEQHVRMMYFGVSVAIASRAFAIGAWVGMIKVHLGL